MFNLGIISLGGIGFKTEWTVAGAAAARTITLPLVNTRAEGALVYDFTVDWGDGSAPSHVTAYNDANRIHTYAADGTYQVEIKGTMEGWAFNYNSDRLKIRKVINWGLAGTFQGFKYLRTGFYGCANLSSLGTGTILASGTGILQDGFYFTFAECTALASVPTELFKNHPSVNLTAFEYTFYACTTLTGLPVDLFRYNTALTANGFKHTFDGCTHITSLPSDLFQYNTALTTNAFDNTFYGCTALASLPASLFQYNTGITTGAFNITFSGCTALTSLPTDLFRYNTALTTNAFQNTFSGCTALASLPTDLFRYNINLTSNAFNNMFGGCTALTALPTDLFRYNTGLTTSSFYNTFSGCTALTALPTDLFRYTTGITDTSFHTTFSGCTTLATVPADLFKYNTAIIDSGSFYGTFNACTKLQLNAHIFYGDGEQGTRFLNKPVGFTTCFTRNSFSGTQGIAPDLWECDFGATITLDVAPVTDWDPGDIITGQTSGSKCTVVSKVSTFVYKIRKYTGLFTLGEIVGVTGVPDKLADQGATRPLFAGNPSTTSCFSGAGNSLTSLSNYASIPANWR
jgi:hypothetical protein